MCVRRSSSRSNPDMSSRRKYWTTIEQLIHYWRINQVLGPWTAADRWPGIDRSEQSPGKLSHHLSHHKPSLSCPLSTVQPVHWSVQCPPCPSLSSSRVRTMDIFARLKTGFLNRKRYQLHYLKLINMTGYPNYCANKKSRIWFCSDKVPL